MIRNPIIAIIDSGIEYSVPFQRKILGGISFYIKNDNLYSSDDISDECGHGTNCAYIINKYCPNIMLYIIKIIDSTNKCSSLLLFEALKHLIRVDVDIINISLSVNGNSFADEISKVIAKLYSQGKYIIVSVENGAENSFPANNEKCLGVAGKIMKKNLYYFNRNSPIQIITDSTPEFSIGLKNKYNWFGSNSKATALMSSKVAELMIKYKSSNKLQFLNVLKKHSANIDSSNDEFMKVPENIELNKKEVEILKKVKSIFLKYMFNNNCETIFVEEGFNLKNSYEFINECEQILGIKINKDEIKIEYFYNFKTLIHYISSYI